MPRGIPNAKRDETGMRYTMFHVPPASVCVDILLANVLVLSAPVLTFRPNPKHVGSNYLKSETQTIWGRNTLRKSKTGAEDVATPQEQRSPLSRMHFEAIPEME